MEAQENPKVEALPAAPETAPSDPVTVEHLTNVIHNLNERMSLLESELSELEQVRGKLRESEKVRIDLSLCLKESGEKILAESQEDETFKAGMLDENKKILEENSLLKEEVKSLKKEKDALEINAKKEKENAIIMEADIKVLKETQKNADSRANALKELDKLMKENEEKSQLNTGNLKKELEEALSSKQVVENENETLRNKISELQTENQALNSSLRTAQHTNSILQAKNTSLQETVDSLEGKLKVQTQFVELLAKKDETIASYLEEIEQLKKSLAESSKFSSTKETELINETMKLSEEFTGIQKAKETLAIEKTELTNKNLALTSKLSAYEQLICSNEDMNALLDERKETIEFLQSEKAKTETALEAALKRVEVVEKRNYQLNKKLNNTLQAIKAKGEQAELLKNYLHEFKAKTYVYVPVEEDVVDVKLAEYLNSLPDPQGLSTLFAREGEGIYHFGTRRIFVKLENGKVIIRVGGGFLHLEEFLEMYGPGEIEKTNKLGKAVQKSPIKRTGTK